MKEAELKVQRMNIKKKEVVVTAFEENALWKMIVSPHHRTSSVDSTTKTFTTNATGGTPDEEDDEEDVDDEAKAPQPPSTSDKVPSLTISLLDSPDIEDH